MADLVTETNCLSVRGGFISKFSVYLLLVMVISAYPDRGSMLDRTFYNGPVYQSPYNQPDNKYPYGYPLQGLANQPVQLPQGANQMYPAQVPANQQLGGQYYIPGLTNGNQVGIPQTGSQMNPAAKLPYLDTGYGVAMPPYQNNVPYQNVQQQQQQQYVPNQQSGFIPVVPNMISNAVQPNQNIKPINTNLNSNLVLGNLANQIAPVASNQPIQIAQPAKPAIAGSQLQPNQIKDSQQGVNGKVSAEGQRQGQSNIDSTGSGIYPAGSQSNSDGRTNIQQQKPYPDNNNAASDYNGGMYPKFYDQRAMVDNANTGYHHGDDLPTATTTVPPRRDQWQSGGRDIPRQGNMSHQPADNTGTDFGPIESYHHSQEYEDRNQKGAMSVKETTQTDSTTGPVIPVQKSQGHSNSEGFQDFSSWMHYDNDDHRVSGKKGVAHPHNLSRQKPPSKSASEIPTVTPETKTEKPAVQPDDDNSGKHTGLDKTGNYQGRIGNLDNDGFNTHQFNDRKNAPGSYPDSANNRFPNKQQRPTYGSNYPPYYDGPSYRNRGRYHYPVWDPYRDEYYYPDNIDNQRLGTSAETDYEDYRPDVNPNLSRPHYGHKTDDNPRGPNRGKLQPGKPNIAVHPSHPHTEPPTTETSPTITTSRPDTHKSSDTDTDTDTGSSESTESQTSDNTADTETQDTEPDSKDTETQSTEGSSTNSNKTETGSVAKENQSGSKENVSEKGKGFELYESDKVEVVSYTDNTQGPIIALALGLAITMIMLIFVGCRLRTVKRRLRKGRALHSNEADYLINGMYL